MIDHVIIGWFSKISIHCRGSDEYAKVTLSWSIDGEGEFTRNYFMNVSQSLVSGECWGHHLDAVLSSLQVNATDACSLKNPIYPIYPTFRELKMKFERGEFYSGKVTNQINAFSLFTYRYRRIFSQDYVSAPFSAFSFPGKSSFRALQRSTLVWLFYRGTATITSPQPPLLI